MPLDLYQAALPYFPVPYRLPGEPPRPAGGAAGAGGHPGAALPLAERSPTGRPDLVLLWGAPAEDLGRPDDRALAGPLAAGYRLVAVSTPTGLGRLYAATPPAR